MKAVFHEGLVQDFNTADAKEKTKKMVMDLPEVGDYRNFCGKRTINERSAVSIWTAFQTKEASHLGEANDMDLERIGIYVAKERFHGTGIMKGDIFIFRQEERTFTSGERSKALVPTTTKREVFCRTTENGELIASNGQCSEDLDPGTSVNMDLMMNAVMSRIERSLEEVDGLIISRSITSNRGIGSTWTGIYVSHEIRDALKKGGLIYEEAKRRFKVKISCTGVLLEKTGIMCRITKISW